MLSTYLQTAKMYIDSIHLELELKQELEPILKTAIAGNQQAMEEIIDRFAEPLRFGTGGIRGLMAAGLNRINKPNIRRATLALVQVANKYVPNNNKAVIGFDTRLQSDSFAMEAAYILAEHGYQVYIGLQPLPTPFLCYAMRQLDVACGIIITASHNPKEYNGYKAYNNLGGQVLDPWDNDIEVIMKHLPMIPRQATKINHSLIKNIPTNIKDKYINLGIKSIRKPKIFKQAKILYTPFHGTGISLVPELYNKAGFKLHICHSQSQQDGNFPTAPKPNPEDRTAYQKSIIEAKRLNADIIISNDPDADRIGLLAKNNHHWKLMTGNDLIALTLDYLCYNKQLSGVVITTVVTSDFIANVAKYYNLEIMWTITGFKYIARCMDRIAKTNDHFAFGAEESLGMQISNKMRDKDGVIATLIVGEMISYYNALNIRPFQAVQLLKEKVGFFYNRLINIEDSTFNSKQRFTNTINNIRQANLTTLSKENINIVEDFQKGIWKSKNNGGIIVDRPNKKEHAKPIELANIIKFRLESGAFIAFRPSGTEPKLKIYLQSCTSHKYLDYLEYEARRILKDYSL